MGTTVNAQETWPLEKCIEYAQQNNLNLKQAQLAVSLAELDEKASRAARLPNLNASGNLGYQNGRTRDPITNIIGNQDFLANSIGLQSNAVLYNGGRLKKQIAQSEYNVIAAQEDANTQFQTIALQISSAYLNVLLSKEQVIIAQKAITQTQEQLSQVDKRIEAGVLPAVERLDILSQIARNEQTMIQASNMVDINLLTLKNFLELDPATEIDVTIPEEILELDLNPEVYTFDIVYAKALESQASIRANEARIKSAELDIPIAKSSGLPSITAFASLDTRWSNVDQVVGVGEPSLSEQPAIINQEPVTVGFFNPNPIFGNISYFDQLDQNFGQTIGVSFNIPIFNRYQTKLNLERARLGVINAEVQNSQVKQQLKADVQQSLANARAAKVDLAAAQKAVEAAKASYTNAEKRYQLGAINSLELTTAKTNLDTAELTVIRAKYEYIFRTKVIDFYLGKKLQLN